MIISRLKDGLGNQMFQYAVGKSLSLLKGDELFLDSSWYERDAPRQYGLAAFNISAKPLGGWLKICINQLRRKHCACLRALLQACRIPFGFKLIVDIKKGFDDRLTKASGNIYLDGYWQSECYFKGIRDIILREFTFKNAPDPLNSAMLASISQGNAVCVHVRRGDYLSTTNQGIHGLCDLDYYRRATEYIRSQVSNPSFFVFSDDPQWVETNFPGVKQLTAVTHNVGCKDLEDLRLMMNCRHFIIANSSFSWWAAWLAQSSDKIVVAPKRWHVSAKLSDKDLIPERWIRL